MGTANAQGFLEHLPHPRLPPSPPRACERHSAVRRVVSLRERYGIPVRSKQQDADSLTVSVASLNCWIDQGLIAAGQAGAGSPLRVRLAASERSFARRCDRASGQDRCRLRAWCAVPAGASRSCCDCTQCAGCCSARGPQSMSGKPQACHSARDGGRSPDDAANNRRHSHIDESIYAIIWQ